MNKKWIHIIGIAGVTTGAMAVMFKEKGWNVTGSDKGFYPPMSTFLKENKINILPGFKKDRLKKNGKSPNIVLVEGVKGDSNPEVAIAKKLNLKLVNFPVLLQDHVINDNHSIVVVGTYGKTTITASLVNIFLSSKKNISWMIGGIPVQKIKPINAKTKNSLFSVVEGDEYLISLNDKRSKFFLYKPNHLIISATKWDHPDLFPTEKSYINNFAKLIKTIPNNGLIVANANDKNTINVCKFAKSKIIYYSSNPKKALVNPDWIIVKDSKPLPCFVKFANKSPVEIIPYEKQVLGDFNDENLLASCVMAYEKGVKKEDIQNAIINFKGIKRRLEIKKQTENYVVIDDFASSPPKVVGALEQIKKLFPKSKIITIFEPNTGNRTIASLQTYPEAFVKTNLVILPRFTKLPTNKLFSYIKEEDIAQKIKEDTNVKIIKDDKILLDFLTKEIKLAQKDQHLVIAFLGSHGFRGLINELVSKNV